MSSRISAKTETYVNEIARGALKVKVASAVWAANMGNGLRINEDEVVELAEMFRLMSDPTRLKIILACLDEPASVGAMAERLDISASLVSHHLRLLRAARLLQADRRGRQVFYVVGDPHIRSMLTDMADHVAEGEAEAEAGGG
jgi:ArsR family transcriptional regulator